MITTFDPASVTEALDRAAMAFWTRQPPQSDRARLRFLLRREADSHALAARLHTDEATLSQLLAGDIPSTDQRLPLRICRELIRTWQPRVRKRAHHKIIANNTSSIGVHFRAKFGFTAGVGTSDDPRLRLMTIWLAPAHAATLLRARDRDADEHELHRIVENATGESYFRVSNTSRLHSVTLTEIDFIDFSYH